MIFITLCVAMGASIAVWVIRPITGLLVYLAVTCLYPQYLAVSIGTIDLSTGRIIVLVLLLRIFTRRLDPVLMRVRWTDVLVLVTFGCSVLAFLTNEDAAKVAEREGGLFFDTVLAYASARLTLRTREDAYSLMRGLVFIGIPLAVIGVNQSLTGFNPYGWMREYSPFGLKEQEMRVRFGLYRADGSFGNKIPFGLFFAMLVALNAALYFARRQHLVRFMFLQGILIAGLISSMSSAPLFALVSLTAFIVSFPVRRAWPYLAFLVVGVCSVIELASDRHFYHVLTRLALNSNTAYYRIQLMEEAFGGGMTGHWLTGYGYVGLAADFGRNGFNWVHADLVNVYIYRLATTGIVGVVPFVLLNIHYYWCLYRGGRAAVSLEDRWAVWCISAGVIGWNIALMTVGALAQTNSLMYVVIALASGSAMIFGADSIEASDTGPASDETPQAATNRPFVQR